MEESKKVMSSRGTKEEEESVTPQRKRREISRGLLPIVNKYMKGTSDGVTSPTRSSERSRTRSMRFSVEGVSSNTSKSTPGGTRIWSGMSSRWRSSGRSSQSTEGVGVVVVGRSSVKSTNEKSPTSVKDAKERSNTSAGVSERSSVRSQWRSNASSTKGGMERSSVRSRKKSSVSTEENTEEGSTRSTERSCQKSTEKSLKRSISRRTDTQDGGRSDTKSMEKSKSNEREMSRSRLGLNKRLQGERSTGERLGSVERFRGNMRNIVRVGVGVMRMNLDTPSGKERSMGGRMRLGGVRSVDKANLSACKSIDNAKESTRSMDTSSESRKSKGKGMRNAVGKRLKWVNQGEGEKVKHMGARRQLTYSPEVVSWSPPPPLHRSPGLLARLKTVPR